MTQFNAWNVFKSRQWRDPEPKKEYDVILLLAEGCMGRQPHTPDYDFNDELLAVGSSYWLDLIKQQIS